MTQIHFTDPEGVRTTCAATPGATLMETAVSQGIHGIIAECGGNCACGTCRVYIDKQWQARIGAPGEIEMSMLEFIDDPDPNLRLSCQIEITPLLDGLQVQVSREQR